MPLKGGPRQNAIKSSLAMKAAKRKGEQLDEPPTKVGTVSPPPDSSGPSVRAVKDYRTYVSDLSLKNKVSAKEARVGSTLASAAGARGVSDFCTVGASGKHDKHAHRDLLSKISKQSELPLP